MPSVTAGKLCPRGVFVTPRMSHYSAESKQIMRLVAATGAMVEQMSIDEAYLDVTGVIAQKNETRAESMLDCAPVLALARELKRNILAERQLTASIGIASNKLLAKLASDFQKPDGLTLIPDRDKVMFLRPLPVRAMHGVGKVTESILNQAGITTVADLQNYNGDLRALVGSFGPTLRRFAFGEDDRPLEPGESVKSISSEETFESDTLDRKILRACLRDQCSEIASELKRKKIGARTIQVKIRYGDFTTLTRQITVEEPIDVVEDLYRLACFLLAREKLVSRPLRLLGVGVSGFGEAPGRQLVLFH